MSGIKMTVVRIFLVHHNDKISFFAGWRYTPQQNQRGGEQKKKKGAKFL